ncbi:hypothetical protein AAMO2058_000581300 [Amorphochlora amoebiformis]
MGLSSLAFKSGIAVLAVIMGFLYTPGPPFPSKGRIDLEDVTRVREGDVTMDELIEAQEPIVLELDHRPVWNWTKLKSKCSHRNVSLISNATYTTLLSLPEPVIRITEIFMAIMGRPTHIHSEIRRRVEFPLGDYVELVEAQKRSGASKFWLPYIFRFVPVEIKMLFDILMRPLYLHDVSLEQFCPELMEDLMVPKILSLNMIHFSPESFFYDEAKQTPFVFFGPKNSMSYPMHHNIFTGDVFMLMVEGTKSFAAFHPRERNNLDPVYGTSVYSADGLDPDLWKTPNLKNAKGIKGELRGGELLFLPGSYIHQFQNEDTGANIGLKFWIASEKRICGKENCSRMISQHANKDLEPYLMGKREEISLKEYRMLHNGVGSENVRRAVARMLST